VKDWEIGELKKYVLHGVKSHKSRKAPDKGNPSFLIPAIPG